MNKVILGELPIDDYVTHTFESLDEVNKSVEALHGGTCLRSVIKINKTPSLNEKPTKIKVVSSQKHFEGVLKTVTHWSYANNCEMKFSIFLPEDSIVGQRGSKYPVLYFLAGLSSTNDNGP